MTRTRGFVSCLAALALVSVWLAAPAAAAPAAQVHCGEVITRSVRLANDLVDCPRHGLVIGAANITVDLNGHTVDGDGTLFDPCPVDEPCNSGIANSGLRNGLPINGSGFPGVTIKDGSVTEFAEGGIYITGTHDNVVRSVRTSSSEHESDGVHLRNCTHCRIENSSASDFSVGMVVERSSDVTVANNDIHDNRVFAGLVVALSHDVTVMSNRVHDNGDSDGIALVDDADDNVVRRNDVFANAGGIGMANGSDHNLVTDNNVYENAFVGVYAVDGVGNAIVRNTVARNSDGFEGGIHLVADPGASGTEVTGNTLSANHGDGIVVDDGNSDTLIERNHADGNTDDGIDVQSAATTVTGNTANGNGDLGIEAVPGVVDGGRNRASGNGNPLQCVNIVCSADPAHP
jgi:parallel beta-helix repeat protein